MHSAPQTPLRGRTSAVAEDSIDAADAATETPLARDAATLRATLTATVHFEFDQSDLRRRRQVAFSTQRSRSCRQIPA